MAFLDETGLTHLWGKIKLAAYPVGSIYTSENSTSPAELFGGTWERLKDRFLLAAGDTYKAGSTGGESQHKLTQGEIPNYKIGDIAGVVPQFHTNWDNGGVTATNMGSTSSAKPGIHNNNGIFDLTDGSQQFGYSVSTYGGDQPHNNMPPYLAIYMWKRIA